MAALAAYLALDHGMRTSATLTLNWISTACLTWILLALRATSKAMTPLSSRSSVDFSVIRGRRMIS